MPGELQRAHLTTAELSRIDGLRAKGRTPKDMLPRINRSRSIRIVAPISFPALCDYLDGQTHGRNATEKLGCKAYGEPIIKAYDKVRKPLQKRADDEYVATWDDIAEEGEKELK